MSHTFRRDLRQELARLTDDLVFSIIAAHADADGRAKVPVRQITAEAGIADATVQNAIKRLEQDRRIKVERLGTARGNVYTVVR